MSEDPTTDGDAPTGEPEPPDEPEPFGPLLDFEEAEALEARDRKHAGPGGEPECPRCGAAMVRSVEQHPAPRADDSPFRVRLVCGAPTCRAWTAYRW